MNQDEAVKALMSLPEVGRISVARLQPTDVIVVESVKKISMEEVRRIEATLHNIWPTNKIIVCDEAMRIKVADGSSEV